MSAAASYFAAGLRSRAFDACREAETAWSRWRKTPDDSPQERLAEREAVYLTGVADYLCDIAGERRITVPTTVGSLWRK